ncbi:hypothetical protein [Bradyrhizobium sp. UFLA05-112]
MQAGHSTVRAARSTGRDRVSNGRLLSRAVDLRSAGGRRFKFLVESYSQQLGGELTEPEKALVRQAVALQLQAERLQERIVGGELVDSDLLIPISSTSKRLLSIIAGKAGQRADPSWLDDLEARYAERDPVGS